MTLEERVRRLEVTIVRWRAGALSLALLLAISFLAAAAPIDEGDKPASEPSTVEKVQAVAPFQPDPDDETPDVTPAPIDVVQCQRLQIVDARGNVVVTLGSDEHGGHMLVRDARERPVAAIACAENDNVLAMYTREEGVAVQLVAKHGLNGGGVEVYNGLKHAVGALTCGKDNSGKVWVADTDGKLAWKPPSD